MTVSLVPRASSSIGQLLRSWRKVRRMSQMELALKAGVSSRHLSFVETGRAQPSRDVVLQIAEGLALPLRDQNALLNAAGYTHAFTEGPLDGPELEQAVRAIHFLLDKLEPYPAWLLDRLWNIHLTNRAALRLVNLFIDGERMAELSSKGQLNVLRLTLSPDLLRPYIVNWEVLAPLLISRVRREAIGGFPDDGENALLAELLELPGIPKSWRLPDPDVHAPPVIPIAFRKGDLELEFITTVTTFGRPQDVVLQEVWIESCFPANPETEKLLQQLARGHVRGSPGSDTRSEAI